MHSTIQNLLDIETNIKNHLNKINIHKNPKIVAVSKTFKIDKILPLIEYGHIDYGENKVQEAVEKWREIKKKNSKIKLHMIGKLQTNKVKFAVSLFDYIHSVDSEKLAKKIADEQNKINKKIKVFLQINIGDEDQKSGIKKAEANQMIAYCKEIGLDLIGLMCIPPFDDNAKKYFDKLRSLRDKLNPNLKLSMGMSGDYKISLECGSNLIRIGSKIFS